MLTESISKPNDSKDRFVCVGYPANFGEERPFDGQHFVKVELPLQNGVQNFPGSWGKER
jgi:hypothetical protein